MFVSKNVIQPSALSEKEIVMEIETLFNFFYVYSKFYVNFSN